MALINNMPAFIAAQGIAECFDTEPADDGDDIKSTRRDDCSSRPTEFRQARRQVLRTSLNTGGNTDFQHEESKPPCVQEEE